MLDELKLAVAQVRKPGALVVAENALAVARARMAAQREEFLRLTASRAVPGGGPDAAQPAATAAEGAAATDAHRDARQAVKAPRQAYAAAVAAAAQPFGSAAAQRAADAAAQLAEALSDLDACIAELERCGAAVKPEARPPAIPHAALQRLPAVWARPVE